jgi:hypothetical protein
MIVGVYGAVTVRQCRRSRSLEEKQAESAQHEIRSLRAIQDSKNLPFTESLKENFSRTETARAMSTLCLTTSVSLCVSGSRSVQFALGAHV